MWKTGHSLIKDKMKEMKAPLAGEMSGHMFFAEGFYGHDDALYGAARLLRIVADSGQDACASCSRTSRSSSRRRRSASTVRDEVKFDDRRPRRAALPRKYDVIDVDGVRVLFGDGWGLIRASNTQPVLVTRYEARTPERLAQIRGEMEGWLRDAGRAGVGMTGRRWVLILVAAAAVALLLGRGVAQIYTDYLWYASLGFPDIWRARYSSLFMLRALVHGHRDGFRLREPVRRAPVRRLARAAAARRQSRHR